jgi:hypothetical protein
MFVAGDTGRNVVRLRDVSVVRVKLFVRVSYASSVREAVCVRIITFTVVGGGKLRALTAPEDTQPPAACTPRARLRAVCARPKRPSCLFASQQSLVGRSAR